MSAFLSIVSLGLGCSQTSTPTQWVLSGHTMGTRYTVKIIDPPTVLDKTVVENGVSEVLSQTDELMSTYKITSEVSQFNKISEGEWFPISPETFFVVNLAQEISHLSQGSFDVTVSPLIELWGFGKGDSANTIPSEEKLQAALRQVGYGSLLLDDDVKAMRKDKPLTVNLSAVAKGYAVDRIAQRLMSFNLDSFLIEVGGEIWAKGLKPGKRPWRIAVESPATDLKSVNGSGSGDGVVSLNEVRVVQRIIDVSEVGVATSGDYRNYFENHGQRYSHIIDPVVGAPVQHNLVSVTVVDASTARADAWATALLVMGLERGLEAAEKNRLAVFFISKTNSGFKETMSQRFNQYLVDDVSN